MPTVMNAILEYWTISETKDILNKDPFPDINTSALLWKKLNYNFSDPWLFFV